MITKFFLALSLILLPYSVFSESSTTDLCSKKIVTSVCQQLEDDESIETIAEALFDDCTPDEIELIKEVARLHGKGHSIPKIVSIIQQSKSEQSKSLLTTPSFWIKAAVATGACMGLCYLLYRYVKHPAPQNNERLQQNVQQQVDPIVQQQNARAEQQAQAHAVQRQQQEVVQQQMLQQERAQQQAHMQQQQRAAQQHMQQQEAQQLANLAQQQERARYEEFRHQVNDFDERIQGFNQQLAHERQQHHARLEELHREQVNLHGNDQAAVNNVIAFINERRNHLERYANLEQQQQALRDERAAYIQRRNL